MAASEIDSQLDQVKNDLIVKGEFDKALDKLSEISQKYPNNKKVQETLNEANEYKKAESTISRYFERQFYKQALNNLKKLMVKVNDSTRLKILECELLIHTDNLADANKAYLQIKNETNEKAKLVHCLMEFYQGNLEEAIKKCKEMEETPMYYRLLTLFEKIKDCMDKGKQSEKKKNYPDAQQHYNNAVEICDTKVGGLCLNKIMTLEAIVKRSKMNSMIDAHIDALLDAQRATNLHISIKDEIIDKKRYALLGTQTFIALANGNARFKKSVPFNEFDAALSLTRDYPDIKKAVLNEISEFEVRNKKVCFGSDAFLNDYESIPPNKDIVDFCLSKLKGKKLEDVISELTNKELDGEEKKRIISYILRRFSPEKLKDFAAAAEEMKKQLNKEAGKSNVSLSEVYDAIKEMTIEEMISHFDIKISSNDDTRSKLRRHLNKNWHPDNYKSKEDKELAAKICELVNK